MPCTHLHILFRCLSHCYLFGNLTYIYPHFIESSNRDLSHLWSYTSLTEPSKPYSCYSCFAQGIQWSLLLKHVQFKNFLELKFPINSLTFPYHLLLVVLVLVSSPSIIVILSASNSFCYLLRSVLSSFIQL